MIATRRANAIPSYAALRPDPSPNRLVVHAAGQLAAGPRVALDVGAGPLGDTRYLLSHGFEVDVVETDEVALAAARKLGDPHLQVLRGDIRRTPVPQGRYGLVVAIHVLPYLPRPDLCHVVAKIGEGLVGGGVLCCTLFGVRDSWRGQYRNLTFLTATEVDDLLAGWEPLLRIEREYPGRDAQGMGKRWHVFRAIVRRP